MAVKIRLRRMGKKKQPIYKIVAADSRSPRDGKYIESLGLYNPLTNPHTIDIKEDRVNYWLDNGAQPTATVKSLIRQKGITLKRELVKRGLSEDKIREELDNWSKLKEASKNKKVSKKAKKQEQVEKPDETEQQSEESTAEVKGAASDENSSESN